jgi:hypothetical protein
LSWPWIIGTVALSGAAFGAGVYIRERRREALRDKLRDLLGASPVGFEASKLLRQQAGSFRFPKPAATPAAKLRRNLETWAVFVDTLIEQYGSDGAQPYQGVIARRVSECPKPVSVGELLWLFLDYKAPGFEGCLTPRPLKCGGTIAMEQQWDKDPARVVRLSEQLVGCALYIAAAIEVATGRAVDLGKPGGPSVVQLAESYATDAAVGYLASAVPGGGAVMAVGSALGGPGWNMGKTERRTLPPLSACWEQYRAAALERAAALIAYAEQNA